MGDQAEVVIVGGGIWGCSVAYHLAQGGCRDILLLERGELASETTSMAAGLITQLRTTRLMYNAIRDTVRTLRGWEAKTGNDCGFREVGSLKVALTDERVAEFRRQVAVLKRWGLEIEFISGPEMERRVPFLSGQAVKAVVWMPTDGYAEPYSLAMAMAREARRMGARLQTHVPVTKIPVQRGRVHGVETPAGTIRAETVVVAAGPWIEVIAKRLGLRVPAVPLRHQLWVAEPMGLPRDFPVVRIPDASVYIRPEVGGLIIGGFEAGPKRFNMARLGQGFHTKGLEQDVTVLERLGKGLTDTFPNLGQVRIVRGCAGLPTFTPDGSYLLGPAPQIKGLYIAAGCNAIGIAGSLPVGQWIAEMILRGKTRADISPQALGRFGGRYRDPRKLARLCADTYANLYSITRGAL